jgi:hypothetical protein
VGSAPEVGKGRVDEVSVKFGVQLFGVQRLYLFSNVVGRTWQLLGGLKWLG